MFSLTHTATQANQLAFRWSERFIRRFSKTAGIISIRDHSFYRRLIDDRSIVVDLGANTGEFSSRLSDLFSCRCYAVEASTPLYRELPCNPLIQTFNYAMSGSDEPVTFYLSQNSEASSRTKSFADAWELGETITVPGMSFETFIKQSGLDVVDLIKCDIEGSEIELFRSISDDRLRRIKQISIEFHDFLEASHIPQIRKIKRRLAALGFTSMTFSLPFSHADVLFLNKKLCKISVLGWLRLYVLKHVVLETRRVRELFKNSLQKALRFRR